jgi:CheY-like chemotaxis protein
VTVLHGELAIDNSPGGTACYLVLPFKRPKGAQPSPAPGCCHFSTARLRILLAEDDAVNMLAEKWMLEKFGFDVTPARNGQEALQLLADQDFDLILMDMQMPVMDGHEATLRNRSSAALGEKSRIPIIALTAYAMTGDREKFLAAGLDAYLAKPVDRTALREAIESVRRKAGHNR